MPAAQAAENFPDTVAIGGWTGASGPATNVWYVYANAGEELYVDLDATVSAPPPGGATTTTVAGGTTIPVTQTGVWKVKMNSTSESDNSAWTIEARSLASGTSTEIPGRVWSELYAMNNVRPAGSGEVAFTTDLHYWVANNAGYIYDVKVTDYDGINSLLAANSVGVGDALCNPLYKSTPISENNTSAIAQELQKCGETYRIFFEEPADDLPATGTSVDGETYIKPALIEGADLEKSTLAFTPSGTDGAGTITANIDERFAGGFTVKLDLNNDGDFTDVEDRTIPYGATGEGSYSRDFDGRDGNGKLIGTCAQFGAQIQFERRGETHFLSGDVEGRSGIEVTRLNGTGTDTDKKTLYWDDSERPITSVSPDNTTPMIDASAGVDSTGTAGKGVHGWGYDYDSWGDLMWIDDWAFDPIMTPVTTEVKTFGAPCPLTVTKSVNPTDGSEVEPGEELTYTLTFVNDNDVSAPISYTDDISDVLDDAAFADPTDKPTGTGGLTAGEVNDAGQFTITGPLAANSTGTVTYTVTVKSDNASRGNDVLANFLFPSTEKPPTECVTDNPLCTTNPVDEFVVTKSVDPVDGTTVSVGDTVTYTLTFANRGEVAHTVGYTDDISDALDDAKFADPTDKPTGTGGLTAGEVNDAGQFTITGPLAANSTGTVTYTLTVKPDADRGNDVLANFLFPSTEQPPTECVTNNPLCTTNPVRELSIDKTVLGTSPVQQADGSWLTKYRIEVTNLGAATTSYDLEDTLRFGGDVQILSSSVSGPEGVETNGSWTGVAPNTVVSTGIELTKGASHRYTVEVTVSLANGAVPGTAFQCQEPGTSGNTGLLNEAAATSNNVTVKDVACPELPLLIEKSVSSGPTMTNNTDYQLSYRITVTNGGTSETSYDLSDDLQYGEGIVITSAKITDAPDGVTVLDTWTGQGAAGSASLLVAEDVPLSSKEVHTYTVTVTGNLPATVFRDPVALVCPGDGSFAQSGGFHNVAVATNPNASVRDNACAVPPTIVLPDIEEPTGGPTPPGTALPVTGSDATVTSLVAGVAGLLVLAGIILLAVRRRTQHTS